MSLRPKKTKGRIKKQTLPKQRKFNVGYMTRIFEQSGRYESKSKAKEAAKKIGDRYYFRYTKVKGTYPNNVQLWKSKKPEWK